MILKKNGKVSIVPKAFAQMNPFFTKRFMATGTAVTPGTTLRKNKKGKVNKNTLSMVAPKATFTTKILEILPWVVTEQVAKELDITEVFQEIKSEGKLTERDRVENLKKCVDSLTNAFEKKFGTTPNGLMSYFVFTLLIKDPSKLGELIFNIIGMKNSFAGHYNLMNVDLRNKSKGIKTGKDEQSDHGVAVSDVGLKLIIQTIRDRLPTLDEFDEIYRALNDKSNKRAVPNDVHEVITGLEAHVLDTNGKRMLSMEEKINNLDATKRKKLNKYLKKINKNFGIVQEEYCENFVSKLSSSQSSFVKSFAENFKDFYINHVLYNTQKGGGGFDSKEQNLLIFLLTLLKDEPDRNKNTLENSNNDMNENDDINISMAYNRLKSIKNLMDGLMKSAKEIYEAAAKDTDKDILDRYNTYLEYDVEKAPIVPMRQLLKSVYDMDSKKDFVEMKGGQTRKLNRRR